MTMKAEAVEEYRPVEEEGAGLRRVTDSDGLSLYMVPDDALPHGSSLGNAHGFLASKGTGAMEGLFNITLGQRVTGALVINYFAEYTDLSRLAVEARHPAAAGMLVRLEQTEPGTFLLHPAYQRHSFTLTGEIAVSETLFLPRTGADDPCLACQIVRLENRSPRPVTLAAIGTLHLPGETATDIRAEYSLRLNALIACNRSHPEWARLFACPDGVDAYLATTDLARAWHPAHPLANTTAEEGDLSGALQVVRFLQPGESAEFAFYVVFSPDGRAAAARDYRTHRDAAALLARTLDTYRAELAGSAITTPDPLVNEGAQWAKANMLRVLAHYPSGQAFTNEPGVSSHVVARDVAWFIYGCDYLQPESGCSMLQMLAETQQPSGKIVEYYDARTLRSEDYGLNVNDATPLFLMAGGHHLGATWHEHCLHTLYPAMVRAADFLLSQCDERGLVFCSSRDVGERGICGWRNVMPNVTLSGAVTEVNCEAYAGLLALSEVARHWERGEDADRFTAAATALRDAIERHLKNPDNGFYYVNIDVDGVPRSEITADLVFPLICQVADEETTRRISDRLNHPDLMSAVGLRTLSRRDPRYTPDRVVGLQGGVWPGVTWWYAMGGAYADPGLMIAMLRRSYWQYVRDPRRYNTVPGQFSEWFDGEALQNRGMRLSPWEPPRFLWALLEGAVGVAPHCDRLLIKPRLPHTWKWVRVCGLPYHGQSISWFLTRQGSAFRIYTASDFQTDLPVERLAEDVSDIVQAQGQGISVTALAEPGQILLCVGNTLASKNPAPLLVRRVLDNARRYRVSLYSSETEHWQQLGDYFGGALERIALDIEASGFILLRFQPLP